MKISNENILLSSEIVEFISKGDYSTAGYYLFQSQLNVWDLMKKNYEALKAVQTKSFWFDGFKVNIQFNPERIISTSAKVDNQSIKNRKCFLCKENLPEEQKGILLPGDFVLLCNPYPIFNQHYTISSLNHQPQTIKENFKSFLEVSKLLSSKYTLIYNGPECGASAPDHLHFQAGTKQFMPIENDIQQMNNDFGKIICQDETLFISFIDDSMRKIILLESADGNKIQSAFELFNKSYAKLVNSKSEPMMNILCNYNEEIGWRLIIFLRSKHRPKYFYKTNTERILVSPAAVDLGGLLITPRKDDFERMNKELVKEIFSEVSLDTKMFLFLLEKLKDQIN